MFRVIMKQYGSENGALENICTSVGGGGGLQHEAGEQHYYRALRNFYSAQNIIRIIKPGMVMRVHGRILLKNWL